LHHIPFLATHLFKDLTKIQAVDITIKSDSIYVISRHSILAILSQPDPNAPKSIIDLYNQLPSSLQRIIGSVTWPEPACLDKIADAIKAGAVIGASDGSVRRAEALSSQAWILHAADGSELTGKGPIQTEFNIFVRHIAQKYRVKRLSFLSSISLSNFMVWSTAKSLLSVITNLL